MSQANILILFAPKFKQFGVDVGKEYLRRKGGGKVHGLCTGPASLKTYVERKLGADAGFFWHLHSEEDHWLARGQTTDNLIRIDQELGPGAVGRIMVADRRVGRGFVRGGLCRPDIIGKACAESSALLPQKYISGLYAFLDKIFLQCKPDSVFCYAVAGAPALALAEMCKARGISFSRPNTVRIGNRSVIDDDPRGRLTCVARCYKRAKDGKQDLGHIIPQARELHQAYRKSPEPPGYMQRNYALLRSNKLFSKFFKAALGTAWHMLKAPGNFKFSREGIARQWFEVWLSWRRMMVSGKHFTSHFPEQKRYIFYPLHVDPEASTMVLSPWHTDQINVIEALAKSAPADMLVVVKEHLPMLGKRPRGFYKTISRIPRVILLRPEENSLTLIQQADIVAVITGTAAWEAMRLGRPALVIGDSPYLAVGEGVVHEPCLANLPDAISNALATPPASEESLELYTAACLHESFEMNPAVIWGKYDEHSHEERQATIDFFVNGILKREEENKW